MRIFTGCILVPVHKDFVDKTIIVSVMSRHTREDGKTPDPRLKYDLHMPYLAPDLQIVGAWYRNEITWDKFAQAYLKMLRTDPKADFWISRLMELSAKYAVIISCIESHHSECHRGLLATYISGEWSKKHPELGPIEVKHLEKPLNTK